jgi:hypothetical protein
LLFSGLADTINIGRVFFALAQTKQFPFVNDVFSFDSHLVPQKGEAAADEDAAEIAEEEDAAAAEGVPEDAGEDPETEVRRQSV